jgi:hypothetical protein
LQKSNRWLKLIYLFGKGCFNVNNPADSKARVNEVIPEKLSDFPVNVSGKFIPK